MSEYPSTTHDDDDRPGVLGQLAERRKEIAAAQVLTVTVPRWEKPIVKVRFRPLTHDQLRAAGKLGEKVMKEKDARKASELELNANADALIQTCEEIVAVVDGAEYGLGPDGAKTRFDGDAAVSLGLDPDVGARAVCRAIFITDADLLATAKELTEWSGYSDDAIEAQLAGE